MQSRTIISRRTLICQLLSSVSQGCATYYIRGTNKLLTKGRVDSGLNLLFLTTITTGRIDIENSVLFSVQDSLPNPGSEKYEELQMRLSVRDRQDEGSHGLQFSKCWPFFHCWGCPLGGHAARSMQSPQCHQVVWQGHAGLAADLCSLKSLFSPLKFSCFYFLRWLFLCFRSPLVIPLFLSCHLTFWQGEHPCRAPQELTYLKTGMEPNLNPLFFSITHTIKIF